MKTLLKLVSVLIILTYAATSHGFGGGKGFVSGSFWAADLGRNEQLSHDEANIHRLKIRKSVDLK